MADRITIRITPEIEAALDRFMAEAVQPEMSRQEAFRQIMSDWLRGRGYFEQPECADTSELWFQGPSGSSTKD